MHDAMDMNIRVWPESRFEDFAQAIEITTDRHGVVFECFVGDPFPSVKREDHFAAVVILQNTQGVVKCLAAWQRDIMIKHAEIICGREDDLYGAHRRFADPRAIFLISAPAQPLSPMRKVSV